MCQKDATYYNNIVFPLCGRNWPSYESIDFPVELTSPPESTFYKARGVVQSPNGLVFFALITHEGTLRRLSLLTKENPQWKAFPTLSIFVLVSIHVLNLHGFFVCFDGDIQMMLRTLTRFLRWYLGPLLMTGSRLKTKANKGYPKANRGWPLSTVNRTSAQCVCKTHEDPHLAISRWDTLLPETMS